MNAKPVDTVLLVAMIILGRSSGGHGGFKYSIAPGSDWNACSSQSRCWTARSALNSFTASPAFCKPYRVVSKVIRSAIEGDNMVHVRKVNC